MKLGWYTPAAALLGPARAEGAAASRAGSSGSYGCGMERAMGIEPT